MSVSRSAVQQCPICRAIQPLNATRCSQCGAVLPGVPTMAASGERSRRLNRSPLDGPSSGAWDEGEADLHEAALPTFSVQGIAVIVVTLALVLGGGFFIATQVADRAFAPTPTPTPPPTLTPIITAAAVSNAVAPPTNTKSVAVIPTVSFPTVTPAPPTPTITPTKGPCMQKVKAGDTVYGLAARCGYKDMSNIVQAILDLNNMKDAGQLQIGQQVQIPWPTPTGGVAQPASTGVGGTPGVAASAPPTLPVGVQFYKVKKLDTAGGIAYFYHTDIKTLRDLNPEIQFLECDFGLQSGGPACNLSPVLTEGQKIRVPAPTPVPTQSPTLTGSETATPSPTPTINAPFSQSPSDNMLFDASQLPTLRWVTSGALGANEIYLITVKNITNNLTYKATTRELFFQLPADWQPTDGKRQDFEWSVTVATLSNGTPAPSGLTTETRTFTWQSR